jgi:Flp pilus assembly protein TadG
MRCAVMEAVRSSRKRAPSRGQTLTEFALVVPVLMMLIMGVLDGALLMFSVGTARYGSAEGSRVAATLGNVGNTDSQVVATIRNIVSGTQLFTVDEVDIYKLNQDGNGNLTQDVSKTNKYALDGTPLNGTPWPATSRNVGNGTSDFIGVTVNYTYKWKAGFFAPLGPLKTTAISYVRIEPQSY